MLIIWGFKARFKAIGGGVFHCPNEGTDRNYQRVEVRRWFTLFWIPLIPLKVLGEGVRCSSCGATYEPRVLELPTTAHMEDQLTRALRHVVVAMLHADEQVSPEERLAAVRVIAEFGFETYDEQSLIHDLETLRVSDLEHELSGVAAMLSPQGQEAVIRACMMLAVADGHLDDRELATIMRAGRGLGMSPAHLRGTLQEIAEDANAAPHQQS